MWVFCFPRRTPVPKLLSIAQQLLNVAAVFSRFFPVKAPGRCVAYLLLKKGATEEIPGLVISPAYHHEINWAQVCLMLLTRCYSVGPTPCRQEHIGCAQNHFLFTIWCTIFAFWRQDIFIVHLYPYMMIHYGVSISRMPKRFNLRAKTEA